MIACIVSGPGAPDPVVARAEQTLGQHGVEVWKAARDQPEASLTAQLSKTNLLVSLGGDGTFLASARLAGPRGIPLLGVNLGLPGFLTELEEEQLEDGITNFLAGKHRIEERTILQVELRRGARRGARTMGLNEVGGKRAEDARMVRGEVGG